MPPSLFAPPTAPTRLSLLLTHPALTLARWLYTTAPPFSPPATSCPSPSSQHPHPHPHPPNRIRILCISDTHNTQPDHLPSADLLIHAGDLTVNGTEAELAAQVAWLKGLAGYEGGKVVVCGNHDFCLDKGMGEEDGGKRERRGGGESDGKGVRGEGEGDVNWGNVIYLSPSCPSTTVKFHGRSLRIYGSPLTPKYGNWAFQYSPSVTNPWTNIPSSTEILVTHGPAKGHLDASPTNPTFLNGCAHLQRALWRVRPRLHVCGHIHAARGVEEGDWGWLRWGYDRVCCGEGGLGTICWMVVVWAGMWLWWGAGGRREREVVSVNAAVVREGKGGSELVEGRVGVVVEV